MCVERGQILKFLNLSTSRINTERSEVPSDASHRIHHLHLPVIIGIHSRKRAHRNKSSVILRGPIKGITDVERDEEGGRETWRARRRKCKGGRQKKCNPIEAADKPILSVRRSNWAISPSLPNNERPPSCSSSRSP